MKESLRRSLECFFLFAAIPLSLLLPVTVGVKAIVVVLAFVYLLYVLFKKTAIGWGFKNKIPWRWFVKHIGFRLLIIVVVTTLFVYAYAPEALFCVPRTNIKLFFIILAVYTFLSVWPQEVIYRSFFFARYSSFFKNQYLLIFVNAVLFSLAHLFFLNLMVSLLTFIGGLLFAHTYAKTRSTLLVSIEHALYGCWLFTVGMGEMLAFPGMGACS